MNKRPKICIACDCSDDQYFHTPADAGPFCGECWEALIDPDQSLLLEKRIAAYELEVEALRSAIATNKLLLIRAADALKSLDERCAEEWDCNIRSFEALEKELRKAAQSVAA
jgi:hypothetical protein